MSWEWGIWLKVRVCDIITFFHYQIYNIRILSWRINRECWLLHDIDCMMIKSTDDRTVSITALDQSLGDLYPKIQSYKSSRQSTYKRQNVSAKISISSLQKAHAILDVPNGSLQGGRTIWHSFHNTKESAFTNTAHVPSRHSCHLHMEYHGLSELCFHLVSKRTKHIFLLKLKIASGEDRSLSVSRSLFRYNFFYFRIGNTDHKH